MATPWCRLWADMPNDPKWRTIAKISKQRIGDVMAVYLHMMVCASNATERGRTEGWCDEDIATALDMETSQVTAIRESMQGRVLDGDYLAGWSKRQPAREDETAATRAKAWREEQKRLADEAEEKRKRTQANASERKITLDTDTDTDDKDQLLMSPETDDDVRKCPSGTLVNLYHELMPSNPRVKVLSKARKSAIRSRWLEAAALDCKPFGYSTRSGGLAAWRQFFEVCAESKFLTGLAPPKPGQVAFVADIDFIFSPSGFAKTLENKYHRDAA